jgi:hypothetical protein
MEKLRFPKFNVPSEANSPAITTGTYATWVIQNWEQLRRAGQFEELLDQPGRCPVDARFRLSTIALELT